MNRQARGKTKDVRLESGNLTSRRTVQLYGIVKDGCSRPGECIPGPLLGSATCGFDMSPSDRRVRDTSNSYRTFDPLLGPIIRNLKTWVVESEELRLSRQNGVDWVVHVASVSRSGLPVAAEEFIESHLVPIVAEEQTADRIVAALETLLARSDAYRGAYLLTALARILKSCYDRLHDPEISHRPPTDDALTREERRKILAESVGDVQRRMYEAYVESEKLEPQQYKRYFRAIHNRLRAEYVHQLSRSDTVRSRCEGCECLRHDLAVPDNERIRSVRNVRFRLPNDIGYLTVDILPHQRERLEQLSGRVVEEVLVERPNTPQPPNRTLWREEDRLLVVVAQDGVHALVDGLEVMGEGGFGGHARASIGLMQWQMKRLLVASSSRLMVMMYLGIRRFPLLRRLELYGGGLKPHEAPHGVHGEPVRYISLSPVPENYVWRVSGFRLRTQSEEGLAPTYSLRKRPSRRDRPRSAPH